MKGSSSGKYYEKLDHVRALAAFLAFSWHAIHLRGAVSVDAVPAFPPLSLIEEGHLGVTLFMTLSGYLFAKIINGRPISIGGFLYNRVLRLFPLLIVALAVGYSLQWWRGTDLTTILTRAYTGFIFPRWPNGAWSITTELHFYLILPVLLPIAWHRPKVLLALILGMIFVRSAIYLDGKDIRHISYWTILGRMDQFLAGIAAHTLLKGRSPKLLPALATALAFIAFWHWLNVTGGYYGSKGSPKWIIIPAVEGLMLAFLIWCYDTSKISIPAMISKPLAFVGTISYSIYLWHLMFLRNFIQPMTQDGTLVMSSLYTALAVSTVLFVGFIPIAYASYRIIETPFLRWRTPYFKDIAESRPKSSGAHTSIVAAIPG